MTTDYPTTTDQPPPGAPQPPAPAPLRRSRADRKIAGVAGGLGRYANVDPLVIRILFVVLAVFGGSGLLLYALGWLFIPDEGETESEAERLVSGRSTSAARAVGVTVLLVIGLIMVAAFADTGPGLGGMGVLAVVAIAVVLLLRGGQRPAQVSSPTYPPAPPGGPGDFGQTTGTAYSPPPAGPAHGPPPPPTTWATAPVPPPAPSPRPKSVLGRVTVSVALIVVGLMVGWNTVSGGSDDDFRAVAVLGTALAVVAGGLLVGAFRGRARGLIWLAIPLAIATSIAAAADEHNSSGVGDPTWAPTTVAAAERDFRLGLGEAELDLTRLPAGSEVSVNARVGFGELLVVVPSDARVTVEGDVGLGSMRLLDDPSIDGTDLHAAVTGEPVGGVGDGTVITLDAEVGLGELEVRR